MTRLALAALATAALLLVACSDRVPAPATPTVTRSPRPATPTASRTPAPEVPDFLQGVDIRPLQFDFDVSVTNMTNLIIELGCTQCDGPTTGFARVYSTCGSGCPRSEVLLTPEMLPLPAAGPEDQRYVAGFGFAPDASDLIAGICVRGYCGWMGVPAPSDEVWLFRSRDGGITWTDYGHLPRAEMVVGWLGPGSVLTSYYDGESETGSYTIRPSGEALRPPANIPNAWPMVTSFGEVLWSAGDGRLFKPDGTIYAQTEQAGVSFAEPLLGSKSHLLPLFWSGDNRHYLAQLEPDGSVRRAFVADPWVNPEAWLSRVSDDRIFATVSMPADRYQTGGPFVGVLPALIDLGSASVMPISQPFLQPPFLNGRNHIVAVQRGPFARVVNTGSCLNIRDAPNESGAVLECVRDGVLLQHEHSVAIGDPRWAWVRAPSGTEGWAHLDYLEP